MIKSLLSCKMVLKITSASCREKSDPKNVLLTLWYEGHSPNISLTFVSGTINVRTIEEVALPLGAHASAGCAKRLFLLTQPRIFCFHYITIANRYVVYAFP